LAKLLEVHLLRKTGRPPASLSEQAYRSIREKILRGEIPLGAPLSRRHLAIEFGMSLIPVTEALQALERDGLVESRPRVGTRVCLPTAEDVRDRYQVREALESQAARLYAERVACHEMPAREIRAMEKMAQRLDTRYSRAAAAAGDRDALYAVHSYHLEFHARIAELARSRVLQEMIEKNHVLIFNWLFDIASSRPPLPPHFHRDLIAALNGGKIEAADRAMREHVRFGLEAVVKNLASRAGATRFERVKQLRSAL
jgi:GntR family transcriptional regulator, rspAB operon transcriptional repressor